MKKLMLLSVVLLSGCHVKFVDNLFHSRHPHKTSTSRSTVQSDIDSTQTDLNRTEEAIQRIDASNAQTEGSITRINKKIADLKAENARLKARPTRTAVVVSQVKVAKTTFRNEKCAEIHFTALTAWKTHIGVMGDQKISGSQCFKLVALFKGKPLRLVRVTPDPVTADYDVVAKALALPVQESLIANTAPGEYVLYIPQKWVQQRQRAEIALGNAHMDHSVGVHPELFSGKPSSVTITLH